MYRWSASTAVRRTWPACTASCRGDLRPDHIGAVVLRAGRVVAPDVCAAAGAASAVTVTVWMTGTGGGAVSVTGTAGAVPMMATGGALLIAATVVGAVLAAFALLLPPLAALMLMMRTAAPTAPTMMMVFRFMVRPPGVVDGVHQSRYVTPCPNTTHERMNVSGCTVQDTCGTVVQDTTDPEGSPCRTNPKPRTGASTSPTTCGTRPTTGRRHRRDDDLGDQPPADQLHHHQQARPQRPAGDLMTIVYPESTPAGAALDPDRGWCPGRGHHARRLLRCVRRRDVRRHLHPSGPAGLAIQTEIRGYGTLTDYTTGEDYGTLTDYTTGEEIRPATKSEQDSPYP